MKIDAAALKRWRANPVLFVEECLIDPETKRPFVLLEAEKRFLEHAFQTDEYDRYPELLYACPKKSGKTTFAAIIVLTMLLLFGGS
jgi:hypothetical protein